MAFGGQMNDAVYRILPHDFAHALVIANICPHECIIWFVLDIPQIIEVSRIGQLVEIDDAAIGILVHEQPHHMAADEPGSAGNQNIFHKLRYFNLFISVLRQQNIQTCPQRCAPIR